MSYTWFGYDKELLKICRYTTVPHLYGSINGNAIMYITALDQDYLSMYNLYISILTFDW